MLTRRVHVTGHLLILVMLCISYWMGSHIGRVCAGVSLKDEPNTSKTSPMSSPVILDGYQSNEKFIAYRTPCIRDRKFMACLFIKPSNITGYWTVCLMGNIT